MQKNNPPKEEQEQITFCTYLRYKGYNFCAQPLSGVPLDSIVFAKKAKEAGNVAGYPDINVNVQSGDFSICQIELKRLNEQYLKKDGQPIDERVSTQIEYQKRANAQKFTKQPKVFCCFASGGSAAIWAFEQYIDNLPAVIDTINKAIKENAFIVAKRGDSGRFEFVLIKPPIVQSALKTKKKR